MLLLEIVILLAFIIGLAYIRAKAWFWTLAMLIVIAALMALPDAHWWFLVPVAVIYVIFALFANITWLRRRFFTRYIIQKARKVLPPISTTEQEALEAGTVWWEAELFCGKPNWKKLHHYPKPTLTTEEQAFLDNETETLCAMIDDWEIMHTHNLGEKVWQYMKDNGFFAMIIPKSYGGLEFSALAQSTIVSKVASKSISAAVTVMVPNSLGPAELLLHYGTDAQKEYYLPRLAKAEEIPCFALTSEEGSDAGAMRDRGVVCKGEHEGKEVLGIRLNWDKRYITLCPVATLLGLAFKLFDPDHLIGDKEALGITCALIPTNYPGVEFGKRHFPMFTGFMNGPTRGKDVFIPLDFIIGGEKMAGKGWRMLMECLSVGRAISLPALSTAGGKMAYRMTGAYARIRKQFRVSIGKFEGVAQEMAKLAGNAYILEAARVMTAGAVSEEIKPSVASAIAKYHMTEMCRSSIDHAMDIHSGKAVQTGPNNYLANGYAAIPISITVEGANILTRNLIIFGQGSVRCHPYLYHEMMALKEKDEKVGLARFDKYLVKHIGHGLANFARTLVLGLSNAEFLSPPRKKNKLKYSYQQLTRMSSSLALVSDFTLLLLGGELKRKEALSARLGDVLSHLYLASCVLKFYHDHGEQEADLPYVRYCIKNALCEIQEAFYGVFANFPVSWVGSLLRFLVFPYGRSYKRPSDKLANQLAESMMVPSDLRERLTQYTFLDKDNDTGASAVEAAFLKYFEVESLLKKINQALKDKVIIREDLFRERVAKMKDAGIFTEDESKSLLEYRDLYEKAIMVDEFDADYFNKK